MVTWNIPDSRKELSRYYTGAETYLTAVPGESPLDDTANQLRRIVEALSLTTPDAAHIPLTTERLRDIADELERYAEPATDRLLGMWEGDGVVRHDPVTGPENTLAPPLVMHVAEDGWVEGEVTLGLPYQGPPAAVHGGICAALLDAALAVANHRAGNNGMTARLEIRYQRPTPLYRPVIVRAKQLRHEGRKRFTVGEIVVDGEVSATAEGLFIARRTSVAAE
ncbi:PaaI family thioesterase [Rhodococcus artemisiae]|uniref:Acyl-coenzyme A thioesterase THEM4 n=1 Tax=Rhodococcus artemisiae TaxID=714159 RepID=A0ABU7L6S5_9NOCA|nr:hotdog domain-containing protein [Rhodococcus artemisiae]MEE2057229.1 hotdog domain-containing protein [Rhodococcus artemisiae]